jgi:hypothetical protein
MGRTRMTEGLEGKIGKATGNRFRSEGERRIAATLDQYGIPFVYEQKVTVNDNGKTRNLRPDFYLPEHDSYIEFYGRVGNQDYDLRTAKKKAAYAANNINVIPLYPWDLLEDWPNYLFNRLPTRPTLQYKSPPIRRYGPVQTNSGYFPRSPRHSSYQPSTRRSYR